MRKTIDFQFFEREAKDPDKPFLRQPFGDKWEVYTWGEAAQMARKLAAGLQSFGFPPKSHIGLISKNCREWVIADMAIIMAGYVSVPMYPTLQADTVEALLDVGDVKAVFAGKVEDWDSMKAGVPADMPTITFPHYKGNSKIERGEQWFDFINRFEPMQGKPEFYEDEIWTIIFTSGTTGTPKGVVLTYGNLDATRKVVETNNMLDISTTGNNRFFSFLPLNHIAERVVVEQACLEFGGSISFAESLNTFVKNLEETEPTLFFAVPRIWTKFQLGVLAKMPQKKLDRLLRIPILSGIIKKKIRKTLGLNEARAAVSGAASIPENLKDWYKKLGIPLAEAYGMTENCALCTALEAGDKKPGSVGKALPGVELKIDGETGEIMMKAACVMKEYYKDWEKTREVLDDGWLHTGDQGKIDKDGYLYITGRVKDTFKTGKGKFIVPGPIERQFENNENIEQLCLLGLGCPQPVLLVVPSEIGLKKPKQELLTNLDDNLEEVNKELPSYQKVSTIVVVKDIWDVSNNLLTPTLKVKRNEMNSRYQNLLLGWHEDKKAVVMES